MAIPTSKSTFKDYCFRALGQGVIDINISDERRAFRDFLVGHAQHLDERGRNGGLEVEFLVSLQGLMPSDRSLICVAAYKDGDYLGGALVSKYGKVAEYLAGHNTSMGRSLNAGQLILWSVIKHLKAKGINKFDLGGMDKSLSPPGIYRFKNRIGGTSYKLANEMEGPAYGLMNRAIRWRVNIKRR